LVTEIQKKLTRNKTGSQISFTQDTSSKKTDLAIYTSGDAGAITMSSSKSDIYMVIS